jgi:hypothetical protein
VTTRGDDGRNAREDLPECNVTQTGVGCGASNIRQHWAGGDDVRISVYLSLSQNVAGAGVMDKRNIGRRAHIRHISVRAGAWHRQRHCRAWRRGLTLACCRTGGRERPGHLMCRLSREQRRPLMGRCSTLRLAMCSTTARKSTASILPLFNVSADMICTSTSSHTQSPSRQFSQGSTVP